LKLVKNKSHNISVVKMNKIYKIVDNTNNNVYVGKTNNMNNRMSTHLSDVKNENKYCSSEIVLKNNDWRLEIIEDNLSKEEVTIKEKYYIQNTENCINHIKYTFNKKEYQKEYHEKNKDKRKEYLQNNKDKIYLQKKEWYQINKQKILQNYSKEKRRAQYEKKVIKSVLDDIIYQIEQVQ